MHIFVGLLVFTFQNRPIPGPQIDSASVCPQCLRLRLRSSQKAASVLYSTSPPPLLDFIAPPTRVSVWYGGMDVPSLPSPFAVAVAVCSSSRRKKNRNILGLAQIEAELCAILVLKFYFYWPRNLRFENDFEIRSPVTCSVLSNLRWLWICW